MAKKEKHTIEVKFLDLKTRFKAGELSTEETDRITCELIAELAVLTTNGISEINGISIDLFKNRVWYIIELAGLLPEYRDPEDEIEEDLESDDDYYKVEEEEEFEIDDSKFYK